jgi:hypothetical protein
LITVAPPYSDILHQAQKCGQIYKNDDFSIFPQHFTHTINPQGIPNASNNTLPHYFYLLLAGASTILAWSRLVSISLRFT